MNFAKFTTLLALVLLGLCGNAAGRNASEQRAVQVESRLGGRETVASPDRTLQAEKIAEIRRDEADLAAQQAMATWAERMFWAASFQALFGLLGLMLIGWTLIHTRRAANYAGAMADEAKRTTGAAIATGEATKESVDLAVRAQRPWVSLSAEPADTLTVAEDHSSVALKLAMHNTGSTPAVNVVARMTAWKVGPGEPDQHQSKKAEILSLLDHDAGGMGFALFPNERVSQVYGATIEGLTRSSSGSGVIWLIAAVRYDFPGGVGRTMIVQFVFKAHPETRSAQPITGSDHHVPASDVVFHRVGLHEIAD